MKKKTKKPLFDSRVPGGKPIVYGAVLMILGALVNSYMSWTLVVGALFGAADDKTVFGPALSLCLQVGLSMLVAIDGINNRNRPSKGKRTILNAACVLVIAVVLVFQNGSWQEGMSTGILIAAFSVAGAMIMMLGGFKNSQVYKK